MGFDSKTGGLQLTEANEGNEGGRGPDSKSDGYKPFVAFVTFCKPLCVDPETGAELLHSAFCIQSRGAKLCSLCLLM
jgi:hypothetical protein